MKNRERGPPPPLAPGWALYSLLEEAYLVAPVPKYSEKGVRRRASPPKLVTLSNALVAAVHADDPTAAEWGTWVENACLARAWNAGQEVHYWREEPFEVDGVLDGSWGPWAIEVKTGRFGPSDLTGLLEFSRRHPRFRPLVVCTEAHRATAERLGVPATTWQSFCLEGPSAAAETTR